MDKRDDPAPESADWYVFGRLAEHYGLPEIARSMYKKVEPADPPLEEAISTRRLADIRLKALEERDDGR